MKIEIQWLDDHYDCDDCGSSWAEGALVKFDGEIALNLAPHAHCYDSISYDRDTVYEMILKELGHTVTIVAE